MTHLLKENNITYLVGDKMVSPRPLIPYDPLVCEFLDDLSSNLRASKAADDYPDIMALAFWCRRANLTKLKTSFDGREARLGLGLVFHITPTNVPVNFAFSFILGLLSGNANIVKVPSKPFPQIDIICAAINRLFEDSKYSKIKTMTAFIKYDDINEITSMFSANCNARIIWGGDKTIQNIRQLPIPVRGREIAFSDRYSFCVIDAPSVMKLEEAELGRLAERFYNDTYLMDQNACSSPHLVVWLGEEKAAAKERFWTALHGIAAEKYQLAAVNAVDKYTLLCHNAIELDNVNCITRHSNSVYRVALDSLPDNMDALRGKCGYFYEHDASDINSIARIVNTKYQTLTYFGVEKSQFLKFVVNNRLLGIDRIVPIGRALDIDLIWDGYDIVKTLSRIIDVR